MSNLYSPYWLWEDFINGMYKEDQNEHFKNLSKIVLSNEYLFFNISKKMIFEWPISTCQNLGNKHINRLAWIGQAACCYAFSVSEINTRIAWKEMSFSENNKANKIAVEVIKLYEKEYNKIYRKMARKRIQKRNTRRNTAQVTCAKQSTFL